MSGMRLCQCHELLDTLTESVVTLTRPGLEQRLLTTCCQADSASDAVLASASGLPTTGGSISH